MKKMKWLHVAMISLVAVGLIAITACDDDDDPVGVDKTELGAKIQEAENLIETTEEGTAEGQYMPGSKADLQETIDVAKGVNNDPDATQVQVNNTVVALDAAIAEYQASIVEAIAPESLVGHWTFDDGTGTTLTDHSGNDHHGTLMSGADTWGGGLPEWTTDRYDQPDKALSFNEGSYVSIPNSASLSPQNISIALWVNAAEIRESNRFIGLHSWNGYKFELQSINKAFFTVNSSEGIHDRDADPPLEIETWYHLAVTFGDGNMIFYINGSEAERWENTPGNALTVTGNDLVFGRDSDEYAATTANYDDDLIIPLEWGGYFHGTMDEVRIYNTVLTIAQVQSIYNLERP
jgi:hypothetical protein